MGYLYLLIKKSFVKNYNNKETNIVCKVGKTDEFHPETRIYIYTKKWKVIIIYLVCNSSFVEREIIKTFKIFFRRRKDLGNEYFEGDIKQMKTEFMNTRKVFKSS